MRAVFKDLEIFNTNNVKPTTGNTSRNTHSHLISELNVLKIVSYLFSFTILIVNIRQHKVNPAASIAEVH